MALSNVFKLFRAEPCSQIIHSTLFHYGTAKKNKPLKTVKIRILFSTVSLHILRIYLINGSFRY